MNSDIDWALDLLSGLGAVRGRRMFGGWGLYLDLRMFALIADGQLFLKVDDETEARFRAAGCVPFVYEAKGKAMTIRYFTPPSEAFDSPDEMLPWARLAWEAAARAALSADKPRKRVVKKRATSGRNAG